MRRSLLRFLALVLLVAVLGAGAGWAMAAFPAVRETAAEAFNDAAEAYIRFVFSLYQRLGGGDAPA